MSSLTTGIRLSWKSRCGVTFADKWLAFLLAAIVSVDPKRQRIYSAVVRGLNRHKAKKPLTLRLISNGKAVTVSIRRGNVADYHIVGRLVRGDYFPIPDFRPKKIIDGGANIGTFSIHAKSYFPEAALICFEPDAENYRLLERNLWQNRIEAELHQLGLWSAPGTAYFRERSSRTGFVQTKPQGIPINVAVPEISTDTWLKLDVEGAEYEILPSLLRTGNLPRLITVEIHDFDSRGRSLLDLLGHHGYSISGDLNPAIKCARISAYQLIS